MDDIVYSEKYGLANTIDNIIYLHPLLKDYPQLEQRIIQHEREHQKSKGFWKNRKIDALTEIKFLELLPVYKKKPSLFLKQYSPISYIDGTLFLEWSLIFLYSLYILIGLGIFFLIKVFSSDTQMFWQIVKWIVILLIGIFGLYQLGKYLRNQINERASEIKDKATTISKLDSLK